MATSQSSGVRWRLIALPTEHGGWALLGSPLLLGMLLAPSLAGVCLGLASLGAFLARHPMRLALSDWRRGKRYPRTVLALWFSCGDGLFAVAFLGIAFTLPHGPFGLALVPAIVLGVVQLLLDLRGDGRSLLAEGLGATALSMLAGAVCLAGGADERRAWLASLVVGLQAVTAVVYASTRLRLLRGKPASRTMVWALHLAALGAVLSLGPLLGAAFGVLAIRAFWGLSPNRHDVKAPIVGMQELAYTIGVLAAAVATFGFGTR